ncbi:MAG: CBS domain-containing protein [Myxococcales bacterium]|nr:CBS domain-containing protein [Myxococcales bacterium]MCB9717743.1 CBS domain-containing protein [Myxococcales bacterium]
MSPDLVCLAPGDRAIEALRYLLSLNIQVAPVLDAKRRPVGMLALSDLIDLRPEERVSDRMSSPVRSVMAEADLAVAREAMADSGFHHLAVTDAEGHAVGFVSAVDLLRAELGRPPHHPSLAPFHDPRRGLPWVDAGPFAAATAAELPSAPGHLVLLAGSRIAWVESCHDLHHRAHDLLQHPPARVVLFLDGGPLRIRYAVLDEGHHRVLGAKG